MSQCRLGFFARAALVALAITAAGCNLGGVRIQIPDFMSRQVEGVWIWRQDASGAFQRFAQLHFEEAATGADGKRYLTYWLQDGTATLTLHSLLESVPGQPSAVELELGFLHADGGSFKVSSYNAAGESSLSAGTLVY